MNIATSSSAEQVGPWSRRIEMETTGMDYEVGHGMFLLGKRQLEVQGNSGAKDWLREEEVLLAGDGGRRRMAECVECSARGSGCSWGAGGQEFTTDI
jgi:hypothetical protein